MNKALLIILMLFISEAYSFQTKFLEEKQFRQLKQTKEFIDNLTPLFKDRLKFKPIIPDIIKNLDSIQIADGPKTEAPADQAELKKLFKNTYGQPVCDISKGKSGDIHRKLKVGMILSGGNAAGGHNVLMIGPPGSGKSMLAKCFSGILQSPFADGKALIGGTCNIYIYRFLG